ncbi:structural protein MipA [Sphingomonas sp. Leaf339]|nr:structural protein MipA [Sphingomonas sp. Leaf339]
MTATAALVAATPALAQDGTQPSATPTSTLAADLDKDTITIAVAGAYLTDYEGSNDYRFVPAPAVQATISGYNIQVIGNRASVDLIRDRPGPVWDLQAGPIGVINFNRQSNKTIDDRRIRALGERNTAIELGGFVGIGKTGVITSDYDKLSATLSYRHDVNNAHDSDIWQPTVAYFTPLNLKTAVGLFVSAERAGGGYARSYYSIDGTQSLASGLAVYNARGGWKNWSVGLAGTYSVTGDLLHGWKAIGGINYRRMLNDFADSPVVSVAGSRGQWLAAAGIGYTF